MGKKKAEPKPCKWCGAIIEQPRCNQRYCCECRKNHRQEIYKGYNLKKKPKAKVTKVHYGDISQCKTCVFRVDVCGELLCNYIEIMGRSRGGEPYPYCVAYIKGNSKSEARRDDFGRAVIGMREKRNGEGR